MSRTTLNIDAPVLRELEQIQQSEKKSLEQIVSELVNEALARRRKIRRPAEDAPGKAQPSSVRPPVIQGATTILARCLGVTGGEKPQAELCLKRGRSILHVAVSEEMAKRLAQSLDEELTLEGQATWRTDTWEIVDFKIFSISEFRGGDPAAVFEELATASRGRWDGVDAEAFVRELRAE